MKRLLLVELVALFVVVTATTVRAQETAERQQVPQLTIRTTPATPPQYPRDTLGMGLPSANSIPPGCAPFGYDGHIECPGFGGSMGYGLGYAGSLGYGPYGYIGPRTFAAWDEETANKIRDRRHSAIVKYDGPRGWLEDVRLEFWDGDDWVVPSRPEGASHRYQKPYIVTVDDAGRIKTRYTDPQGVSMVRNEKLVSMAQAASNGKRGYINKIPIDPGWFKPKTAGQ